MRFVVTLLSFVLLSVAAAQQSHRYMGTDARMGVSPVGACPFLRESIVCKGMAAKRLLTFPLLAT